MSRDIDINDEFGRSLLAKAAERPPSEPRCFNNRDGDCIEFLFSDEGFHAEDIDKLVTVYYGRDSGEIVGSFVKGVQRFIKQIIEECPGFLLEVEDNKVRLAHLFTAGMWKQGDADVVGKYKRLRDTADQYHIVVDVPELLSM